MATLPENKDFFISRRQRWTHEALETFIYNFFRRFVRQRTSCNCLSHPDYRAKAYVIPTLLLCDWSVVRTASKPQTQYKRNVIRMWAAVSLGEALRDIPKKRLRRRLLFNWTAIQPSSPFITDHKLYNEFRWVCNDEFIRQSIKYQN